MFFKMGTVLFADGSGTRAIKVPLECTWEEKCDMYSRQHSCLISCNVSKKHANFSSHKCLLWSG